LLRCLAIDGQIGSDGLSAATSTARLEIRKLLGQYQLANGSLRAHNLQIDSLGGQINADLEMQHLDTMPASQLRASLRSISLQAAQQAVHEPDPNVSPSQEYLTARRRPHGRVPSATWLPAPTELRAAPTTSPIAGGQTSQSTV